MASTYDKQAQQLETVWTIKNTWRVLLGLVWEGPSADCAVTSSCTAQDADLQLVLRSRDGETLLASDSAVESFIDEAAAVDTGDVLELKYRATTSLVPASVSSGLIGIEYTSP